MSIEPQIWVNILGLAGVVVFNAGGIVWLARNHFSEVRRRFDVLDEKIEGFDGRLRAVENGLAAVTLQSASLRSFIADQAQLK